MGVCGGSALAPHQAPQAGAPDKRPDVDSDTQVDRLLVVRHEHRRRLAEHRLCKLHDAHGVGGHLVAVQLVHTNVAILKAENGRGGWVATACARHTN
eukprot:270746-Chlamydomonas_euryale.AAC.13